MSECANLDALMEKLTSEEMLLGISIKSTESTIFCEEICSHFTPQLKDYIDSNNDGDNTFMAYNFISIITNFMDENGSLSKLVNSKNPQIEKAFEIIFANFCKIYLEIMRVRQLVDSTIRKEPGLSNGSAFSRVSNNKIINLPLEPVVHDEKDGELIDKNESILI